MNKQKFIECLRDPTKIKDEEIAELDQLIQEFPYFQGARALSAKISKEKKRKDLNKKLTSAAVYATDRVLLKRYISDHLFFIHTKEEAKERTETPSTASSPVKPPSKKKAASPTLKTPTKPEVKPASKSKPAAPSLPKAEVSVDPPARKIDTEISAPSVPEKDFDLDELIAEIYLDIEELKKSKKRFQEMEKRLEEEDAVDAAIKKASSLKKTPKKKPAEPEAKTEKPSSEPEKTEKASSEPEKTVKASSKPEKTEKASNEPEKTVKASSKPEKTEKASNEPEKTVKASSKPEKTEKASSEPEKTEKTSDSLKVKIATAKPDEKPKELAEEDEKAIENNLPLNAISAEEDGLVDALNKPDKKKEESESPQEEVSDTLKVVRRRSGKVQSTTYESRKKGSEEEKIIDEFITNSPKITPAKKEEGEKEEKEDLADTSTRFQADIGTEYLAEIYVEQGKIDRAISIYKKLGLKFPQKKSFFAARIKDLESKKE